MLTSSTEINISELPLDIQTKLPYTIRTYKDLYVYGDLPYDIQEIIKNYYERKKEVGYNQYLDCIPEISQYGDFKVITSIYELVTEYLKNYLLINIRHYPFDPTFGCKLKTYLQKLDTDVQYRLIYNEIENISRILSSDLSIPIEVKDVTVNKSASANDMVEYNCTIILKINNQQKSLTLTTS